MNEKNLDIRNDSHIVLRRMQTLFQFGTRICADLGEKCEKWKSLGKPGLSNDSHDENRRKKFFTVLAETIGLIEENAQMSQGLTANYDKLIESLKGSVK